MVMSVWPSVTTRELWMNFTKLDICGGLLKFVHVFQFWLRALYEKMYVKFSVPLRRISFSLSCEMFIGRNVVVIKVWGEELNACFMPLVRFPQVFRLHAFRQLNTFYFHAGAYCLHVKSTIMKPASTCEILVNFVRSIRHKITENSQRHTRCRENLKYHSFCRNFLRYWRSSLIGC